VTTGSQKAAQPGSSYITPFNKVVIVVKASDLGLNPGDVIDGFVAGVSQSTDPGATVGRGATALYDEMPNGLAFTGTYTVNDNNFCPHLVAKHDGAGIDAESFERRPSGNLHGDRQFNFGWHANR